MFLFARELTSSGSGPVPWVRTEKSSWSGQIHVMAAAMFMHRKLMIRGKTSGVMEELLWFLRLAARRIPSPYPMGLEVLTLCGKIIAMN